MLAPNKRQTQTPGQCPACPYRRHGPGIYFDGLLRTSGDTRYRGERAGARGNEGLPIPLLPQNNPEVRGHKFNNAPVGVCPRVCAPPAPSGERGRRALRRQGYVTSKTHGGGRVCAAAGSSVTRGRHATCLITCHGTGGRTNRAERQRRARREGPVFYVALCARPLRPERYKLRVTIWRPLMWVGFNSVTELCNDVGAGRRVARGLHRTSNRLSHYELNKRNAVGKNDEHPL
ncbi:hypothetical protein EVAR_85348_1 [Eumeta japonica]|uniref:Uncharacterized protein n=1 Tax=Eumeta variegata TaxID=151549 RepID=A0A4C1WVC0_EUMVA|nr:hypothetical protein EVAR_85348_1 [Eumeta japonica]